MQKDFFFSHFPSVDKWTSLSVVSSYLSGEGLPGLLHVEMEHICGVAWSIRELNSSIWLLMTHSSDGAGGIQQKKQRQCLNTLSSRLCDNGPRRRHVSLLTRSADMEVERRAAADKASGKRCVHHFEWNEMVSRCRPTGKCGSQGQSVNRILVVLVLCQCHFSSFLSHLVQALCKLNLLFCPC